MHENYVAAQAKAGQWIKLCRRGFANEHAHRAWMRAHILEMQPWPEGLRLSVVVAWMNSGPKEASHSEPAEGGPK